MEMKQLQYFYTLCNTKNISVAARIHYISQQGLSSSMKKLETELGVPLFSRGKRGTYPNEYAMEILPQVESLLSHYDVILEIAESNKRKVSGSVEIAADLMLLDYLPHGTEARLKETFPNLAYHIFDTNDLSAMDAILTDKADIAVISGPVDRQLFHYTELHRYPYVAIVNENDSLYHEEKITLGDLHCHDIIMPSAKSNMYENLIQQCDMQNINLHIKYRASDSQHLMYLCSVEPAVGIISSFYCSYFAPRNFRIIPLDEPSLYWTIEIVNAKNRQLTNAAICWKDYIIDASIKMKKNLEHEKK